MTRADAEALYDQGREPTVAKLLELWHRVERAEEKTKQSSRNTSRSPSSDAPAQRARRRSAQSKRRPGRTQGGQPGHPGHQRELLPPEAVDAVQTHVPVECEQCRHDLRGVTPEPEPLRHQVFELPQVKAHVTEHQQHAVCCPDCQHVTRAPLPHGVPTGQFGPRLLAVVAVCTGVYHLSKRVVVELLSDLLGVRLSLGAVCGCEKLVSEALATPVAEARAYVQRQPYVHADETGWWQKHLRAWLWVAATPLVAVFLIHASRGTTAAEQLLAGFAGILVSDRWSAYNRWIVWMRQLCWAHLLRDFQAMAERGGDSERIGKALLAEGEQMFHWWHRVRDGTLARSSFRTYMGPLRRRVEALLQDGERCGHAKTAGMCHNILKYAPALWTFVTVKGVEPTNNFAERIVRAGVMWRRRCFGTQSEAGSRFVERILSVAATCRLQGRNVVAYLTAACTAALHGEPAPSLLPDAEPAETLAEAA
jgi:transposase